MRKTLLIIAAATLACVGCKTDKEEAVIGKPDVKVVDGRFTPEVMWSLGVMSEYAVSPDGSQVLYTLRYTDMEQADSGGSLYVVLPKK